jgi:AcrR family transcriptional regulator
MSHQNAALVPEIVAGHHADARVLRSRERILAALGELESTGRPLTVSALMAAAGGSRSVFYAHFSSLGDVAVYLFEEHVSAIADDDLLIRRQAGGDEAARSSLTRLVAHVSDHGDLYAAVFSTEEGRSQFHRALLTRFESVVDQIFRRSGQLPRAVDPDVAAAFVAAGIVGVISGWICGGQTRSQEDLVTDLVSLLPSWARV